MGIENDHTDGKYDSHKCDPRSTEMDDNERLQVKQDDTSPLWDIKNEMDDRALGTEQMPDSLTLNDITAYYAYSGYASENVNYIVNNDNGYFMVYRLDCEFEEQDMQYEHFACLIFQGSYSILRIRAYALSELVSIPDALFCIYMLM